MASICIGELYSQLRYPNDIECHTIVRSRRAKNSPKIVERVCGFINKMEHTLPSELLERMNNNINSLSIIKKYRILSFRRGKRFDGSYNSFTNEIELYDLNSIEHECFHLASALITIWRNKEDNRLIFLGFKDGVFGKGLNEAYTQLLTERYFPDVPKTYRRLVPIASRLESIVGENTMTSLYFGNGLKGLYDELINYVYEDEEDNRVERLIRSMDSLEIMDDLEEDLNKDGYIIDSYKSIIYFYSVKLYKEVLEGKKTLEEALDEYDLFMYNMINEDFDTEALQYNKLANYDNVIGEISLEGCFKRNLLIEKCNRLNKNKKSL